MNKYLFSRTFLLPVLSLLLGSVYGYSQTTPTRFQGKSLSAESVKISWTGTGDSFNIQRSVDGVTYLDLTTVDGTVFSFTDNGLSASSPYLYKVCSIVGGVKSSYTSALGIATKVLPTLTDITDDISGVLTAQHENTSTTENSRKILDNDFSTKYLMNASTGWVVYYFPTGAIVKQYLIGSGNDAPERDPKEWTLEGSNDNANWILLDTKTNQVFAGRNSKLQYAISNTESFKYFRYTVVKNNSSILTQYSELQLFAECTITRNNVIPNVPTAFKFSTERSVNGLEQIMPSSNQIILNWSDNSTNEDYTVLERSTDQINWDWTEKIIKNSTRYRATDLKPSTTYFFRLKTVNDVGSSAYTSIVSATTKTDVPPDSIVEDWDVHRATLYLQYYDDQCAIYYDKDVDPTIVWTRTIFGGIWKYLKETYGSYSDPRLYVYFHAAKYSGGHPSTWARADHHYRNILDLGTDAGTASAWQSFGGNNLDLPIHEIGHIMEGASLHVNGSPERVIWGDSKYAEIFNYDVYMKNNQTDQAKRWYDMQMANSDSSTPRSGIFWFRDWYYPIYSQYGGSKMLADFFVQMAKYIPQKNGDYTRDMNWGEFIHFYSIAAGMNLKEQATKAFGWSDQWEAQFVKAQADFPATYPSPSYNLMTDGTSDVNFENTNASQNSSKLFDGNYSTNYIADRTGYSTTPFTITVTGTGASMLNNYSLVSAGNVLQTSQYDPAEWKMYGSDNTTDWVVIDTQTSQLFSTRMLKKTYSLTGTTPYLNYKLEITKLRNPTSQTMYLAELELKGTAVDITLSNPNVSAKSPDLMGLINSLNDYPDNNLKIVSLDGRIVFNGTATGEMWKSMMTGNLLSKGVYIYSLCKKPGNPILSGKMMVK